MEDKKIVILFPGANYNTDNPLLYYAGFKFETRGYEKLDISYKDLLKQDKSIEVLMEDIKSLVLEQLQYFSLSDYSDIVFVSKSLGTVIAGWIEEQLGLKVRHIYLTPLKETLVYIHNKKDIITVIAGTKDKYLNADILKKHCIREEVDLMQVDGAGHRLEVRDDMDKNIEILAEIVKMY